MHLTQTAIITKRIITLTLVASILGIVSFIGYKIWYAYYLSTLPPVEEKPDTKFGVLPFPDLPKSAVSSSNFSYTLDTSTGSLPKVGQDEGFEKIIKVYFIPKPYATLLSGEKAEALAEKFGITIPPEILSETNYSFKDKEKTVTVDLDSGNFIYAKESTTSAKENLDDDDKLVLDFENVLSNLGVFKEELKKGRTKVTLLKPAGNKLIPTTLRTEAQAAQVSLWPESLDKKSIFTSDFNKAQVFATVVKSASSLENYLSLNFTFWPIDSTTFATYPTKSAESALEDLKSGKGMIIIEPAKPQVSITSIYLGYFLADNYSPYLQPIFIFEGPSFVAYVPAVSEQFLTPAR